MLTYYSKLVFLPFQYCTYSEFSLKSNHGLGCSVAEEKVWELDLKAKWNTGVNNTIFVLEINVLSISLLPSLHRFPLIRIFYNLLHWQDHLHRFNHCAVFYSCSPPLVCLYHREVELIARGLSFQKSVLKWTQKCWAAVHCILRINLPIHSCCWCNLEWKTHIVFVVLRWKLCVEVKVVSLWLDSPFWETGREDGTT